MKYCNYNNQDEDITIIAIILNIGTKLKVSGGTWLIKSISELYFINPERMNGKADHGSFQTQI